MTIENEDELSTKNETDTESMKTALDRITDAFWATDQFYKWLVDQIIILNPSVFWFFPYYLK